MIDTTRHIDVFNPGEWGARRVDIIGVGAIGSKIALSLAKLGVQQLHVWDHDVIEAHNIANQVYAQGHIGGSKAAAMADIAEYMTGTRPQEHGKWDGERGLGEVVFLPVDSMAVRREFFEAHRVSASTKLIIETRMGATHGQVLSYRPNDRASLDRYEATLFSDDDAEVEANACGTAITVGPTGDIISGFAVWRFLRYVAGEEVEPELAIGGRSPQLVRL